MFYGAIISTTLNISISMKPTSIGYYRVVTTTMTEWLSKHLCNRARQSVNKEYLSQIQLYSIFSKLPVMSNTVLIITVCVKVAKSTFLVTNKRTKWAELSMYYLYNCFVR